MSKQKKLVLIPLLIISVTLIYCWITFLKTEVGTTWRHNLGLILFIPILIFFFINYKITTVAIGIYLILASFNLIAFTPAISTFGIRVGSISTPDIQGLSLVYFMGYFTLNMDSLIDIYLDYKESKLKHN